MRSFSHADGRLRRAISVLMRQPRPGKRLRSAGERPFAAELLDHVSPWQRHPPSVVDGLAREHLRRLEGEHGVECNDSSRVQPHRAVQGLVGRRAKSDQHHVRRVVWRYGFGDLGDVFEIHGQSYDEFGLAGLLPDSRRVRLMSTRTDRNPHAAHWRANSTQRREGPTWGSVATFKNTIVGPEDLPWHLGHDPEQAGRAECHRAFDDLPAILTFCDCDRPCTLRDLHSDLVGRCGRRDPFGDSLDVVERETLVRRLGVDEVLLAGRLTPFDRVLTETRRQDPRRRSFRAG